MTTVEEEYDIDIYTDIYGNLAESTTKYTLVEEIKILSRLNEIQGISIARSTRIVELMYSYSKSKVLFYSLLELLILALLVMIHLLV